MRAGARVEALRGGEGLLAPSSFSSRSAERGGQLRDPRQETAPAGPSPAIVNTYYPGDGHGRGRRDDHHARRRPRRPADRHRGRRPGPRHPDAGRRTSTPQHGRLRRRRRGGTPCGYTSAAQHRALRVRRRASSLGGRQPDHPRDATEAGCSTPTRNAAADNTTQGSDVSGRPGAPVQLGHADSGLTAAPWNGSTGGILAIDVSGNAQPQRRHRQRRRPRVPRRRRAPADRGYGWRQHRLGPGLGARTSTAPRARASPERRAGSTTRDRHDGRLGDRLPQRRCNPSTAARRAGRPATAGGGGTDGQPSANDQNSGGGGGGNGGTGRQGGRSWNSGSTVGGLRRQSSFPASATQGRPRRRRRRRHTQQQHGRDRVQRRGRRRNRP